MAALVLLPGFPRALLPSHFQEVRSICANMCSSPLFCVRAPPFQVLTWTKEHLQGNVFNFRLTSVITLSVGLLPDSTLPVRGCFLLCNHLGVGPFLRVTG